MLSCIVYPNEDIPKDEYIQDYINHDSVFMYNNDEYKIETIGELYHNDYYIYNELHIVYRIFKNGEEIKSNDIINYIYSDCDYINGGPFDNYYTIDTIESEGKPFGWVLYVGGMCGTTSFQFTSEIILPPFNNGEVIQKSTQLSKKEQIFRQVDNQLIFYYFPQKWNFGGTSTSELIPRKLVYNITNHQIGAEPISMDDLPYINFWFNEIL